MTIFRDVEIVVIISGINGMYLDMCSFIFVLESRSIEKSIDKFVNLRKQIWEVPLCVES